jgi:hypothetical protein
MGRCMSDTCLATGADGTPVQPSFRGCPGYVKETQGHLSNTLAITAGTRSSHAEARSNLPE